MSSSPLLGSLPDYLLDRVRQDPGADVVVDGSTPVVAFGNARKATTATLGLNPSRVEFLDRAGKELDGPKRRLETLKSLGVDSLAGADESTLASVVAGCDDYFNRVPYRQWFDKIELVLGGLDASYYNGTACHLDLVQWQPTRCGEARCGDPTAPRQGGLELLDLQLREESIERLLLNGRSVLTVFQANSGCRLDLVNELSVGSVRAQIYVGEYAGWQSWGGARTSNRPSSINRSLRLALRDEVRRLLEQLVS
jgi:hypothetical protein